MVAKAATTADRLIVTKAQTSGTLTTFLGEPTCAVPWQATIAYPKQYVVSLQTVGVRVNTHHQGLNEKFNRLAEQWSRETGHESFVQRAAVHPAYQQIIGMGPSVIPLMLRDLEKTHRQWFWALRAITGQSPIPDESKGNVREMVEAWLDWGRRNQYIN